MARIKIPTKASLISRHATLCQPTKHVMLAIITRYVGRCSSAHHQTHTGKRKVGKCLADKEEKPHFATEINTKQHFRGDVSLGGGSTVGELTNYRPYYVPRSHSCSGSPLYICPLPRGVELLFH